MATDYLELLVALAGGRGNGEVEGAVVGGLAAVVALVRPAALREGSRSLLVSNITLTAPLSQYSRGHQRLDHDTISLRLGELLLEAVAWAGGLEGDLGEAGKQV